MMKQLFALLVTLSMIIGVSAAQSDGWQITLYDESPNLVHIVNAAGVEQSITLPLMSTGERFIPHQVSDDLRYAVGVVKYDEPPQVLPAIADLSAGTCCRFIPVPRRQNDEFYIRFTNFLPGTTRFALSINTFDFDVPDSIPGWIALIDAVDGRIISNIVLPEHYAYITTLEADGVRFLEAPFGPTEWFPYGYFNIWNPATNTIIENSEDFTPGFQGDLLESTGEVVMGIYDTDFPVPYSEFMLPPGNTVRYFEQMTGDIPNLLSQPEGGATVYFDADHMETAPKWVLNGDAFAVYSTFSGDKNNIDIVQRGQNAVTVPTPDMTFLTGTPDGWLMFDEEQGILYHFTQAGDGFISNELARFRADIRILSQSPKMGTTVTGEFLEYTLPEPGFPFGGAICEEGAGLPSRLSIGRRGWVLPGPANNFRNEPSLNGEVIGQLQGSVAFEVLEGPVCADGLMWWRVRDFYGNPGWTAEGNSSEYWLGPLPE